MPTSLSSATGLPLGNPGAPAGLARRYSQFIGHKLLEFFLTVHGLGAFALITLSVAITKANIARPLIYPLARAQIYRAGMLLLPMVAFLSLALGLVIIGQTVSLLSRVGAQNYAGTVMVTVVVRELGPLSMALLVLARVGTADVVELGTARASGEVEALEAMGIDPIHYLVVPRVAGIAFAIFALTVYLIIGALISGYLWAFLQDIPLRPSEYFDQLASALHWEDFVLLFLKTFSFGVLIAVITSYQGLAQPLRLEDVPAASTRAVTQSVISCILLDAFFMIIYLVL